MPQQSFLNAQADDIDDEFFLLAEERCRRAELEVDQLRATLLDRETEISALKLKLAKIVRSGHHLLTDEQISLLRRSNSPRSPSSIGDNNNIDTKSIDSDSGSLIAVRPVSKA